MKTVERKVLTLMLIACVSFIALGAKACPQSERERNVAYAQDIADAFRAAEPLVIQLKPDLAANYHKGVEIANNVIEAIRAGNSTTTAQLLADLIPIFNSTAAAFTGNMKVLTILALADIGLHFLLNHLPQEKPAGIKRGVHAQRSLDVLEEFRNQQEWGCAYHPDKCK